MTLPKKEIRRLADMIMQPGKEANDELVSLFGEILEVNKKFIKEELQATEGSLFPSVDRKNDIR